MLTVIEGLATLESLRRSYTLQTLATHLCRHRKTDELTVALFQIRLGGPDLRRLYSPELE
jgi:hypothetical protein